METLRHITALIAFAAAVIFGTAGIVGLFRFPDPYSRLQAGSLCGTTAVFSIFIGSLALAPNWAVAARIIIITLFFLISSPTGTHIVARFTWNFRSSPLETSNFPEGSPPEEGRASGESFKSGGGGQMTILILILIILLSFYSLASGDLLHGVIALSAVSLLSAILFYILNAPDVAITEAAVGTGVSTVVFVWAIRSTQTKDQP